MTPLPSDMKIYDDLEQGTEEWLEARRGILTASTIGKLITPKTMKVASNDTARALIRALTAERITGHIEPVFVSADMEFGQMIEPIARQMYAEWQNVEVREVGFITREIDGHMLGYSPDGLIGDDGLIEIKSRRQHIQLDTILTGNVPGANMAQIQTGLLVTGRAWCDYLSFCPQMPLYRIRVKPQKLWQDAIRAALETFEDVAAGYIANYEQATEGLPVADRIDMHAEMVI